MNVTDASDLLDLLSAGPRQPRPKPRSGPSGHCTLRVHRRDLSAERAIEALAALPLVRPSHATLTAAVWSLRDRLSAYDATYATLAKGLGARLLTCDSRLARGEAGLVAVTDLAR